MCCPVPLTCIQYIHMPSMTQVKQTKLFSKEKIQKPPTQKDSEVKPSDVKPSSESTNKQPVSDENTEKPPAKV